MRVEKKSEVARAKYERARAEREAEGKSEELQYADDNRAQLVLRGKQLCERMAIHEVVEACSELGCTVVRVRRKA